MVGHPHALVIPTHVVAGDFSNLMGCILLHQLPFQVSYPILERILPLILALEDWLAGYFVFVDTTLLFQYLYYTKSSNPHHEAISILHPVIHTERTPS